MLCTGLAREGSASLTRTTDTHLVAERWVSLNRGEVSVVGVLALCLWLLIGILTFGLFLLV